ncbi:BTAD domain-containing putative transcriptional regulator [Actinophytocola sp.]|uniref:BTAD domain-containing putative transcriptional regulator n=1 Tax=Actinophytocola sp. TaxID=1872138 RepID=UPI002D7E4DBB|nr:BTAD domain-containing putative transcriptional regulator [Actinophytocola sp.]HET9141724.1 BTAD domain-containing putative transcriptional regulator [Actinophytocola sp.]
MRLYEPVVGGLLTGSSDLPRQLEIEIPRPRLVELLALRWGRPVTLLVAGAGFGKTTVLAQAVRTHLLAPRGVDAWVSCTALHGDPAALTAAVLDALPAAPDRPAARTVLDALIRIAPLEVCLIFDDVHEIPAGSPGAALLREFLRTLPATAHVVLSGRETPDLPLARREAAGELIRIGADELSFTEIEVCALARRLGREPALARPLRGWPALVRLAFAAGPGAPWRYAREEILGRIPNEWRRALAALAALGTATSAEVAAVTGEAVDLDELVTRIPLVTVLDDGRYRAHDLWTEALSWTSTAHQTRELHRGAAAILTGRGDLARAGTLACRTRDWCLLAELSVELVITTLSALPSAVARRWLAAIPPHEAAGPAFLLLHAAALHAADFADPRIDPLLDRAWHAMRESGGGDAGLVAVLAQAGIAAHSRADLMRLAELADRAGQLDDPSSPIVRCLRHTVAATLAEVGGDPEAALAEIVLAPVLQVPRVLALSTLRFHYHCLDMCGFCGAAAELADRTVGVSSDENVQFAAAIARWFDGVPADLDRLRAVSARLGPDAGTARDTFVTTACLAVIASSLGAGPPALFSGTPEDHPNPRDAVLAAAASAAVAVAGGDDAGARRTYARHLDRWPVESPFNERHLRRFLALGYVLSERLRDRWECAELGPSHRRARDAARALVRARAGDLTPAGRLPPAHALCHLPLPWSVELATRLAAADEPAGIELGRWLADTVGPAVHRWLRQHERSTERPLAAGAARLLGALPTPPVHRARVEVIGALRVTLDGVPVDAPQLRRVRVRQLLGALVLRPVLAREQAIDLLWPDLAPADAARNLRVTLTHLRRLLEPDRCARDASFHLRTDRDSIRLVCSPWLEVDLWTFDRLADQAALARADGDVDQATDLLETAVSLWSGEPLPDLRDLPDSQVAIEIDRIRVRHVRNLLELGELRMVAGEPAESARLAVRALAVEPYDARGHRLALAAAIKGRDPVRIAAVRTTVLTALRELGAAPDPATQLLLGQLRTLG